MHHEFLVKVIYGKVDNTSSFSFTVGQSYNADGQLAGHSYPDGSAGQYSYDKGRLSLVTLPDQSQIRYGNYQWLTATRIETPGATKTISLDALQRPLSIEVKNAAAELLASRHYQYDKAGNITQIDSDLGTTEYGYDNLDRLTQASPNQNLQGLGLPQEMYSYDAVGNRITSAHQPGTWTYNDDNQLVRYPSQKPFSQMAPQDTQVSYTPQGHTQKETSSKGEKTYSYNAAERLTRYENPQGLQAHYRYDPFGRRISKKVMQGVASEIIYFIYSEQALLGEVSEDGRLAKAYGFNSVAGQQGLWSTDPIWQAEAANGSLTDSRTNYYYLHADHLGTPMIATDKAGVATWKAVAEAFGSTEAIESTVQVNLRFPGQYFDEEKNTNYNLYRDYKPSVGRFMQEDPIALFDGVNVYDYVKSRPNMNIDPMGLAVTWKGSISGGGAVYGAGGYLGIFDLESECKCNKKYKITGGVSLLSIGVGAQGMPVLGGAGSSVTMIDKFADCPDPSAATGSAWSSGVNAVFGGGISIAGVWRLGRLKSEGALIDKAVGLDLSMSIGMGRSAVKSVVEEKCGECG